MATTMNIEILEDGKICVTTGKIGDSVHLDADQLLDELADLMGGERTTKPNEETAGKVFFKKHRVLRGGKVVKA